jgi:hypothetical protein
MEDDLAEDVQRMGFHRFRFRGVGPPIIERRLSDALADRAARKLPLVTVGWSGSMTATPS